MICRLWHGWTTPANADAYEELLREEVFVGIEARGIPGFRGIEMLRRPAGGEVEFVTLMWFTSVDDVRQFAGEDYTKSVVPEAARRILERFDAEATHYEVSIPRA